MVIKHIPMRAAKKSSFAGLVKYLADDQGVENRLDDIRISNCEALTVDAALPQILVTQRANKRASGDKTYHLLISFPEGERPGKDVLASIERGACEALGFGEHQRISVAHSDTDNFHIHVAINKIHPVKLTMHEPFKAYPKLAQFAALAEAEHGLKPTNHVPQHRLSQNRTHDMERHSGEQSLKSWIQENCTTDLKQAQSWNEAHQTLARHGLTLRRQGNGLVFETEAAITIKASTVDRQFSFAKMQERFGDFEESPFHHVEAQRRYEKKPRSNEAASSDLYEQYRREQESVKQALPTVLAALTKDRRADVNQALRANKLRRRLIKMTGANRHLKRIMYAQAHRALRNELKRINTASRADRDRVYQSHKRATWADWLKAQAKAGNKEALAALRKRQEAKTGNAGNSVTGAPRTATQPSKIDTITKQGTIVFRANTTQPIRHDGRRFLVADSATSKDLQTVLAEARRLYGQRLVVSGGDDFKRRLVRAAATLRPPITFDDPGLQEQQTAIRGTYDGRSDRRRYSGAGAAVERGSRQGEGRRADAASRRLADQSHVGRPGQNPPPEAQHRLRGLSSLGVVRFSQGSEMLLPGNVSGDLEHQRAEPVNPLRRSGDSGRLAAAAYIEERNAKRALGFDISSHKPYTDDVAGALVFAGLRKKDDQDLALLANGQAILVQPISKQDAYRLKRIKRGAAVSMTASGAIKATKARRTL